ncbi:MAG: TPM domain-containing protein [Actinobacteria bacterium]|nr:TPM domain-containing protein [Actinomycetota bacterium]
MTRRLALLAVLAVLALPLPAGAQEGPTCPEFEGVACEGWVTDTAGVVADDAALEAAVGRVVAAHGHEIAVVVIGSSGSLSPREFAEGLGNTWGVGDAAANDGIVVLVAIGERRTEIVTGSGLTLGGLDDVAAAGNSFFGAGDYDGGISAILGSLDALLAGGAAPVPTVDPGGEPSPSGPGVGTIVLGVALVGGGAWLVNRGRTSRRDRIRRRRTQLVDAQLERLEPGGHELPLAADYALPAPPPSQEMEAARGLAVLRGLADRHAAADEEALRALWGAGALDVLERDRLLRETAVPLELAAADERGMLEDAVQQAARDALEVGPKDEDGFGVALDHVRRLVNSLRPHRIAGARRRAGAVIADALTDTGIGAVLVTDLGRRLDRAAPALDASATLSEAVAEMETAYRAAAAKTERLQALYDRLPDATTRPAVAAALADLDDDPDAAIERYEHLRTDLESRGGDLEADGLQLPAIAALLLMNRDEGNVAEFADTYRRRRDAGSEPAEAVEYALAGLRDPDEIRRIRKAAKRLSLPVSITAALLRRRDDGPEVYQELADELAGHLDGDTLPTVAGILAISLEPAQAMRRWLEARAALAELGLQGSYADVAAAFGASDRRGPRAFALAYAAQRQALARSEIDDADRFAPELAHEGTSRQTDSWTGDPIPASYGSFDPFTFFYYHWVITKGTGDAYGWEPVYRDTSWSKDRGSWWGGFGGGGGFGSSGSSWGGSSWGSGGGTSFGGFGGGGGFSGGGGGGSGW